VAVRKRAAVYLRVSTEEQTLDNQLSLHETGVHFFGGSPRDLSWGEPSPVELPHEHGVDLAAPRRVHDALQSGAAVVGAASGLLDIEGDAKVVALGGLSKFFARGGRVLVDGARPVEIGVR